MRLSEQKHDVALLCHFESLSDCLWPVVNDKKVFTYNLAFFFSSYCNHFKELNRIFTTRVFICKNNYVAELCCNLSLKRTLCKVAFAAAAKEGKNTAIAALAERRENCLKA